MSFPDFLAYSLNLGIPRALGCLAVLHKELAHLCVHLFAFVQLSPGKNIAVARGLHPWLRDISPFVTLLSRVAQPGIFFPRRCLLFFRGISDFHDGGKLVK
jgi:hypothetical protein